MESLLSMIASTRDGNEGNGNDDDVIINYITDMDLGEDSDSPAGKGRRKLCSISVEVQSPLVLYKNPEEVGKVELNLCLCKLLTRDLRCFSCIGDIFELSTIDSFASRARAIDYSEMFNNY